MPAEAAGRPRRSPLALAVVGVLVLGALAWAVANSRLFAIDGVEVRGNVVLTADRVVRLSGIDRGDNLVRLSSEEVRRRLSRSPWVAAVEVERWFPSTVVIHVTERTAVAWVRAPDRRLPVAPDGTVLAPRGRVLEDLPSLGRISEPLRPGDVLSGSAGTLRVAASLPPDLRTVVDTIAVEGEEITLGLRPRGRVLYGSPTAMGRKNDAVVSLLRWATQRELSLGYIDVRVPARPALKPAGEPSTASPDVG